LNRRERERAMERARERESEQERERARERAIETEREREREGGRESDLARRAWGGAALALGRVSSCGAIALGAIDVGSDARNLFEDRDLGSEGAQTEVALRHRLFEGSQFKNNYFTENP